MFGVKHTRESVAFELIALLKEGSVFCAEESDVAEVSDDRDRGRSAGRGRIDSELDNGLGQARAKEGIRWYVVITMAKSEHIAAFHLRRTEVGVFAPKLRFRKETRRGAVWFLESLFPSVVFARFSEASIAEVRIIPGVSRIHEVRSPELLELTITSLQRQFGATDTALGNDSDSGASALPRADDRAVLDLSVLRNKSPAERLELLFEALSAVPAATKAVRGGTPQI